MTRIVWKYAPMAGAGQPAQSSWLRGRNLIKLRSLGRPPHSSAGDERRSTYWVGMVTAYHEREGAKLAKYEQWRIALDEGWRRLDIHKQSHSPTRARACAYAVRMYASPMPN